MTISNRAYARHRQSHFLPGGTPKAVRVAIASGRLATSLTPDGRIRDAAAADLEWASSTHADRVPITGPTSPSSRAHPQQAPRDAVEDSSYDILTGALVEAALEGAADRKAAARALVKLVKPLIRSEARLWSASAAELALALGMLESLVDDVLTRCTNHPKETP